MKKSMDLQVSTYLKANFLDLSSRHKAKQENKTKGTASTGKIHYRDTFDKYKSSLRCAARYCQDKYGIQKLKEMTVQMGNDYLASRVKAGISQTQLSSDRNAIEYLTGKNSLNKVKTTKEEKVTRKNCTLEQLKFIKEKLS